MSEDYRDSLDYGDEYDYDPSLSSDLPASASPYGALSISTIMNNPTRSSYLPANLSALNPLRNASGPKTGNTRGKPAAPVVLSPLPPVKKADFDPYIAEIGAEWAKWSIPQRPPSTQAESRTATPLDRGVPSTSTVAQIFFEENFDLSNSRTFDLVTAVAGNTSTSNKNYDTDIASDHLLQEKLSQYLDIVEQHLAHEIATRSASFFSALSNLQSLSAQSSSALEQIDSLQASLQQVKEQTAQKGVDLLKLTKTRDDLQEVEYGMDRIKDTLRAVNQAEELAAHGEWTEALDLIDAIESEFAYEPPPDPQPNIPASVSIPKLAVIAEDEDEPSSLSEPSTTPKSKIALFKIKALEAVPMRLSGLRLSIASTVNSELVGLLLYDVRKHLTEYITSNGQTFLSSDISDITAVKSSKACNILVRCGQHAVETFTSSWREIMGKEVKTILRSNLPLAKDLANVVSNGDEDEIASIATATRRSTDVPAQDKSNLTERSNALAKTLISLSHEDFFSLCKASFTSLYGLILLISAQAIALSAQFSAKFPVDSELQDAVHASAELANMRFSKVLTVRTEVHNALQPKQFYEMFEETWGFVIKCETAVKRVCLGLRGAITSQAKSFLQSFHNRQISNSALVVEQELWAPASVPPHSQHIIDLILQGAVSDPPELSFTSSADYDALDRTGEAAKTINIDDKPYFAVVASLKCLDALIEYLKIVVAINLLTTDVMGRVVEFLKQFNSRTCQVVLGAGAMRSAGLKNITAKHLALASQSLSMMILLIPHVRELIRRHLNTKQAVLLVEFDKLKRDYQEHMYEIHNKLVSIMADRLAVHCKTLEGIDWDTVQLTKTGGANSYMESLVKECMTLHKVLSKYIHLDTLDLIMSQVLAVINSKLAEEFAKIELKSDNAKAVLLNDATYLKDKFAELKGLERKPPGDELENLVQTLNVIPPPPQPVLPVSKKEAKSKPSPAKTTKKSIELPRPSLARSASIKIVDSEATTRANSPLPPLPTTEEPSAQEVSKETETATNVDTPPMLEQAQIEVTADDKVEESNQQTDQVGQQDNQPEISENQPKAAELVDEPKPAEEPTPMEGTSSSEPPPRVLSPPAPTKPLLNTLPPSNVKDRLAGLFGKRNLSSTTSVIPPALVQPVTTEKVEEKAEDGNSESPLPVTDDKPEAISKQLIESSIVAARDVAIEISPADIPLPQDDDLDIAMDVESTGDAEGSLHEAASKLDSQQETQLEIENLDLATPRPNPKPFFEVPSTPPRIAGNDQISPSLTESSLIDHGTDGAAAFESPSTASNDEYERTNENWVEEETHEIGNESSVLSPDDL